MLDKTDDVNKLSLFFTSAGDLTTQSQLNVHLLACLLWTFWSIYTVLLSLNCHRTVDVKLSVWISWKHHNKQISQPWFFVKIFVTNKDHTIKIWTWRDEGIRVEGWREEGWVMMDEGTRGKFSRTQMDRCQVNGGRLREPVELESHLNSLFKQFGAV